MNNLSMPEILCFKKPRVATARIRPTELVHGRLGSWPNCDMGVSHDKCKLSNSTILAY